MNITDYEAPEAPILWSVTVKTIFDRQRELMVKYKEIEQLPDAPVSLHTLTGQKLIKDFAWRTTEELCESFEAWGKHDKEMAKLHACEELADAMHFFVELLIFAGIHEDSCVAVLPLFPDQNRSFYVTPAKYWNPVFQLGIAMNFLRNKPWKQSQVATDEGRFRTQLLWTWRAMIVLWAELGLTQEQLYTFYFRKSMVNQFRQRSNY